MSLELGLAIRSSAVLLLPRGSSEILSAITPGAKIAKKHVSIRKPPCDLGAARKRLSFFESAFPMFVPSLSWQDDRVNDMKKRPLFFAPRAFTISARTCGLHATHGSQHALHRTHRQPKTRPNVFFVCGGAPLGRANERAFAKTGSGRTSGKLI
jgi:hypothetical protein